MGSGNDSLIYRMAENSGAFEIYDGSLGINTLQLDFTNAQSLTKAVRNDVRQFLDALNGVDGFSRAARTELRV